MKRKTKTSCPVEGPGRGIETGQRGEKCAVAHGLRPTLGRLMCVFCALKNGQKMALWRVFAEIIRHAHFLSPLESVRA